MKIVYDENYGELSFAQRAAYRKFNVSPSDHDALRQRLGPNHAAITAAAKQFSARTGIFSVFDFWKA